MPITEKGVEIGEVKRQTNSARFKTKVGLEALRDVMPVHQIAQEYAVHPVQAGQVDRGPPSSSEGRAIVKEAKPTAARSSSVSPLTRR